MKRTLREKVQMYKLVHDLLEENRQVWENVPKFAFTVDLFASKYTSLKDLAGEHQLYYSVGVKTKRDKTRKELVELTLKVTKALKTHASLEDDRELFENCKVSEKKISQCSQVEILLKVDRVLFLVANMEAQLAEYGISTEMLNSLRTYRDDLAVGYLAPRKTILKRKEVGSSIQNLAKEIDDLLRNKLDNLCSILGMNNPEFFKSYKNARKVVRVVFHNSLPTETPEEPDDGVIED